MWRKKELEVLQQESPKCKYWFMDFCHVCPSYLLRSTMNYDLQFLNRTIQSDHCIRYALRWLDWMPFCLQNSLKSLWHRFNKVLETFIRDFGSYCHDSITELLQICQLHLNDANILFHISKKKPVWDDLSFVTWCIILLEVAIGGWLHCGHKGMDMASSNTQVNCAV